jgi:leucyl/phenylalanyl-tRNA--protein transferase
MPLVNIFPPVKQATEDGLIGIGGILTADSVWDAYQQGIFPWYNEGEPLQWYCPDPRFVLFPQKVKISHSMKSVLRSGAFTFSMNQHFEEVIQRCRYSERKGQSGTWITDDMVRVYTELHQQGKVISAECILNGKLVGGLYGVQLQHIFCGESMFSDASNASKFALISLVKYLQQLEISLIDCQVFTEHLQSLGAEMISRQRYFEILRHGS